MSSEIPPKVFISYSHDDVDHKEWVKRLATRLREGGVDAVLDQWDLVPGQDIPSFMEQNLTSCDFAILICTSRYSTKANAGSGGVGYEKMIVSAELAKSIDQKKFIPIVRNNPSGNLPTFLASRLYVDFSVDDGYEIGVDELRRAIFREALATKPPLGRATKIASPLSDVSHPNLQDGRLTPVQRRVLTLIAMIYNTQGIVWTPRNSLKSVAGNIALDVALEWLIDQKIIERGSSKEGAVYALTASGKRMAIELQLVDESPLGSH